MRPAETTVTIVVLNWNAERDTAACLESFLAQRGVRVSILLVDNASVDGSADRLRQRFPQVSYLQTGANLGYSGGNNRGIAWAVERRAERILVVNNDTVADPDCVRRLLEAASTDARLAAVAPLIVRQDDPERIWFAGGRFDRVRGIGVHAHEGEPAGMLRRPDTTQSEWRPATFLTGCCLLLRADALAEVGVFREDFFAYGEDVELCLRLRAAGWHIGWVPGAKLAHRVPPRGAPPTPEQIKLRDRNRRRLVRLHYRWPWRLAFSLWFWPTRLVHLVRYASRGDLGRARAILVGMWER
jgi:GT2 family glycosyltransferase